jgi:hypothetical protein
MTASPAERMPDESPAPIHEQPHSVDPLIPAKPKPNREEEQQVPAEEPTNPALPPDSNTEDDNKDPERPNET